MFTHSNQLQPAL